MASAAQASREPLIPLLAKLETVAILDEEDRKALLTIGAEARSLGPRRSIIDEGERPEQAHLIVEGWAQRYQLLPDGRRQITAFLIPGDFCDLHVSILGEMDHGIATLTPAKVAFIPRGVIAALAERPKVAKAMWWATLVDESVLRAWIVNIGRRDAHQAVGHLFCELYVRLRNVGLTDNHRFDLPLTQEEIGDALGLTPVHVNRVLQRMRSEDLITLKHGSLTIHDYGRLEKASGFSGHYLHIKQRI